MSRCWMTSGKQSPAVTGRVSEARSGRNAAALVERVSGPMCQQHGDATEKNIAGTSKRYIRCIRLRVLNEVQQ